MKISLMFIRLALEEEEARERRMENRSVWEKEEDEGFLRGIFNGGKGFKNGENKEEDDEEDDNVDTLVGSSTDSPRKRRT